jgi:hypothetical protein
MIYRIRGERANHTLPMQFAMIWLKYKHYIVNQSNNQETLAILGTGRIKNKNEKQSTAQKKMSNAYPTKNGGEHKCSPGISSSFI